MLKITSGVTSRLPNYISWCLKTISRLEMLSMYIYFFNPIVYRNIIIMVWRNTNITLNFDASLIIEPRRDHWLRTKYYKHLLYNYDTLYIEYIIKIYNKSKYTFEVFDCVCLSKLSTSFTFLIFDISEILFQTISYLFKIY